MLPQFKRREHRFVERMSAVMTMMCVRDGCNNLNVIHRPDSIIAGLIKAGILPEEALVGQLKVGSLIRTGCAVEISYLAHYENDIKDWVEDNTDHNADDVFNVLGIGSILALFNNKTTAHSELLRDIAPVISALPPAMQTKCMTSRETADKLFHVSTNV